MQESVKLALIVWIFLSSLAEFEYHSSSSLLFKGAEFFFADDFALSFACGTAGDGTFPPAAGLDAAVASARSCCPLVQELSYQSI